MTEDEEIDAMKTVANALSQLNEPARIRVLQWAASKFNQRPEPVGQPRTTAASAVGSNAVILGASSPDTFAELFELVNPSTDRERALVAAYWTQVVQSQQIFAAQSLNDLLKNLGHGVSNITDALSSLKDERPALVLQLKKSGTSKQARKTYKLTIEGIRRVQGMLSRDLQSLE